MAGRRFSLEAVFRAKDGGWGSNIDRMKARVGKFNAKVGGSMAKAKQFGKRWGEATAPVRRFGRATAAVGIGVGFAAKRMLDEVTEEGVGFEKTMSVASAKFGDAAKLNSAAFANLNTKAKEVGATTEFSAKEAAGALKFMAMAGEDPTIAMGVLADAANFATAGEVELTRATDIMSDAMGPMMGKVEGAENKLAAYQKTMDLMTHATTRGNMGIEEMFEATKMGAAAFRGGGQDIEMFTGAVATLSNAGIKGSKAGKDLSRIIRKLAAPTKEAARWMDSVKFDPIDSDGSIKDFDVLMREMRDKTKDLDEGQRAKFMAQVIGAQSDATARALMENVDGITKLAGEAHGALGLTAKQAEGIRDTTEGMQKMWASTKASIKLAAFDEVKDVYNEILASAVQWGQANKDAIAGKFRDGIAWIRDNFDTIVSTLESLGIAIAVFAAMSVAVKAVTLTVAAYEAAVLVAEVGAKAWSITTGLLSKGLGAMGSQLMATRGDLRQVGGMINGMHGPVGKLGGAVGLAGAAWASWTFTKWLMEATGADKWISSTIEKLGGLRDEMERLDALNERAAVTSRAEQIQRVRQDLADEEKAFNEGGFMDQAMGVQDARSAEIQRLKDELRRLNKAKAFKAAGLDTSDAEANAKFDQMQASLAELNAAKHSRRSNVKPEALAQKQAEFDRAKLEFDTMQGGKAGAGIENMIRTAAAMTMGEGGAQGLAPGEPVPEVGVAPPPVPTAQAAETMAAEAQGVLMGQILDELRKANTRTDKHQINIKAPAGAEVDGEAANGGVTVERTGSM